MIINKKINRTIMESKSQYLGAFVLIVLSCLLFTMFNLLSINMAGLSSSFEKNYNQEDANFMIDKRLDNIEYLESKYNMSIEETKSVDYTLSEDKTLRIFSRNTRVNIPAIIESSPSGSGNILIDPAFAKANKINIGDSLKVYNKVFTVSGFMSLPNYIYPLRSVSDIMNDPNNFGIAVIDKNEFSNINNSKSSYTIRLNGDRSNLHDRMSQFKNHLRNENYIILNWMNISDNPRVTFVTAKLEGIDKMSSSMPIAILLLTCILTGIIMWRMLKREAVIIGTFYALGYRKGEILKHYFLYPITISLSGGVLGTLLGALTLRPMLNFMVSYFNMPVGSLNFNANYIIISIFLPVIFLIICSYLVINNSLKNSPVDLMKGGKKKNKVGFIERKVKLERLNFNTKFMIREQLRSIPRSIFLLFGIIIATMMLLLGFSAKSSIDYLMRDSFNEAFKYNYHYVFNSVQQGDPENGEAFSEIPFSLKSDDKVNFTVYGVSPNSRYISFKDRSGNIINSDRVIITRPLADKLNLKPKDKLKIVNRLDSKEYSITVDNIAETYVGHYIYIPLENLNAMLGFPTGSYMGLWSSEQLDIPESKLLASVTVEDMRKAFDTMTQPLQVSMGVISFMSFIIGLLVIYVVTSLTIEENRENISLMKVLGYRKKEVYSLILNSSSFIVVIGYILGVPLLLASLSAMYSSVTKDMNLSIPVTINYSYVLVGFIIIYFTYELSKLLSRRKISRISMAEALKSRLE